ncbi:imidazole glycerol phosphate synthase subunit HisH, partial [Promicromonospora kroppenstedtii]|uniref:imidazole glycerol phosphate synthase subunit HisH n=1 Tax=Promicromonospora kroppenstedtii TaxID=440482 RepID=UPI00056A5095
ACMAGLTAVRGHEVVGRRLAGNRPVLGICVGMQVMFDAGVEHGERADGIGEWPGVVERLHADVVPHMGWSPVEVPEGSALFAGITDERFYFVHSYAAQTFTKGYDENAVGRFTPPKVTWADHGGRFVAAVEDGPLAATQFHPEKSGDAGAQLLENWLRTLA